MAAVMLCAVAARGLFLTAPRVLVDDEQHYAEALFHFLRGRILAGVSDYWSFFYPFAALPFASVTGDPERALRLLSILAGSATAVVVFLIGRNLWGRRPGILAGFFTAFHPFLMQSHTSAMTEPLYSFLLLLALYLFLEHLAGRAPRGLFGAAFAIGLAYLTRQEAEFFLALFLIVLLLRRAGPAGPIPLRARLWRAGTMLGIFLVILAPYVTLIHAKTGRWTLGSKATVNVLSPSIFEERPERERFLYLLNAAGTGRAVEDEGQENLIKTAWRQKRVLAAHYAANLRDSMSILPAYLASPFLLLFVPLGLLGRRLPRENRWAELTLLLAGMLPFFIYAAFVIDYRYFVATLPICLLWGGIGCSLFLDWVRENLSSRRAVKVAALAVIFTVFVPYTVRKYHATAASQPLESREIGTWIARNEGSSGPILAKPGCSVNYYAGYPLSTYIPWTDVPGLLRFARAKGFRYLLLHQDFIRDLRPTLHGLLDDPPPPGLQEIHSFLDRGGGKVILYRIAPGT